MGQLLSLATVDRGVGLLSEAAAEDRLESLLAQGSASTERDLDGVTAHLSKTGGKSSSWMNGMVLSWRRRGAFIWALFAWRDHATGSITSYWPRDRPGRAKWKKDNPPSPLFRLARSLVLPREAMAKPALHELLVLQAALHAVQEGLVDLSQDSGGGKLYGRFRSLAKGLMPPIGLHDDDAEHITLKVYSELYQPGARQGFLGASYAGSFPRWVSQRLRREGVELLVGKNFRPDSEVWTRSVGAQVPPGLRQAAMLLGVSKDTVRRTLRRLGHQSLDSTSWPSVFATITEKTEWRELQVRLERELGLTRDAARKRIYRHRKSGRTCEQATRREFPPSDGVPEAVPDEEEAWAAIEAFFESRGYSGAEASRAVRDLRADGYSTPQAAALRAIDLLPDSGVPDP